MKKFLVLVLILFFCSAVLAELPVRKISNPPVGTFRKQRNGKIVQYDKSGKKIGIYKINNGKYIQIK